jgi:predicted DNA-binding antitoxin AbrB/MazE fold protein
MGLEIEAIYEKGILKLVRELPLVEGAVVRITIHPPGRPVVVTHTRIPHSGNTDEVKHFLDDPDEGMWGGHDV